MSIPVNVNGETKYRDPIMNKQVFGNTIVLERSTVAQSVSANISTQLAYDTIVYQKDNYFDLSIANSIKIMHDGLYTIVGTLKLNTSTQNTVYVLDLKVNGTIVRSRRIVDIDAQPLDWGLSDVLYLTKDDVLTLELTPSANCTVEPGSILQLLAVA